MPIATATASAVDVLVQATTDVFDTMVFRAIAPQEPVWGHEMRPTSQIVGTVGFTGSSSGVVSFHASLEAARDVTSAMLGQSDNPEDVVVDAIGEIANMIAGAFRTRMARPDDVWAITVPTLTVGSDFYIKPITEADRAIVGFMMDAHQLFVELIITPARLAD
jgi:chemotaxis protein CheX